MFKKCPSCGFKNPIDVGDCLACKRNLPLTVGEFKEGMETLKKAVKGDWSEVAQKGAEDFVSSTVSSVKYRFHPIWILKVKLHHFKQSLITAFWIFAIIAVMVIIGVVYNFLTGKQ